MEITDTTSEIEEEMGYEHGKLDISHDWDPRHLSTADPDAWASVSDAYRSGYEAAWNDGQVSIG